MSKKDKAVRKGKRTVQKIREKNPFEIGFKHGVFYIRRKDNELDIQEFKPDTEGKVYLAIVDGQDTEVKKVRKHGDDLVLEYEDKACALTSKPLLIGNHQLYFTKNGFQGTMAINKDTLLSGDVYQPSLEEHTRKISKDVDFERAGINLTDIEVVEETDSYYKIENDELGDIATLHGSKKTLKEMNKAKRLRKLLQPSKMNKKRLLLAVGAGIGIGIMLAPRIMEGMN